MAGTFETGIAASSNRPVQWEQRISAAASGAAARLHRYKYVALVLFSSLYLLATCYRASRKLFWFDELFTLYISRLPDMPSVWNALKHGADFNPPLFYAITRSFESLTGEGQVATRLPEILGFWIFCLCLFRFVSTRTSVLAGLISMLFPLVTTAYYYAYEARPHGINLGFCGVALICWQRADRSRRKGWWLVGLFGALACAILNHTYAIILPVPFALAELVRAISLRRVDWAIWLAIVSSPLTALFSIPLWRAAKASLPPTFFPAKVSALANSYQFHLMPAAGVLAAGLLLYIVFTFVAPGSSSAEGSDQSLQLHEVSALIGFVLVPFFSFLLAKLTGAPLFDRYSISTVAGFACLFGMVAAKRPPVGLSVLFLLCAQIGINHLAYARTVSIVEPSSSLALSTRPDKFANSYRQMEEFRDKTSPIVILDDLESFPIMHYAPPALSGRLVYLAPVGDLAGEFYRCGYRFYRGPGAAESMAGFVSTHRAFVVQSNTRSLSRLDYFIRQGASIRMENASTDSFLMSVTFEKRQRESASLHEQH
jgi:hypothetical protein